MRSNPKTIKLAKIRKYMRQATSWHAVDRGMPDFYDKPKEQYLKACAVPSVTETNCDDREEILKDFPYYYTRSDQAIRAIAKKIYDLINC